MLYHYLFEIGFLHMPLDGLHLHNRQHGKFAKRHLHVALVQFLQQHGNGKSSGELGPGTIIGRRTFPSCEALNPCPEAGSGNTAGGFAALIHFIV